MIPVDMLGETIYQVVYWHGKVSKPAPGCGTCGHPNERPTYEYLYKAKILPKKVLYVGQDCIVCDFSYIHDGDYEGDIRDEVYPLDFPFTDGDTTKGFPVFANRKQANDYVEAQGYTMVSA